MLKLRLSSTASPTSTALSLTEEYDEIQRANIFPSVQEDVSVASRISHTMDASVRSGSDESHVTRVEDLRAQVESLRAQLAERDITVNNLQRQIQEDKRKNDKMQTRWDLFFGSSHTGTPSRTHSHKEETTTLAQSEMLKLNKHMDQLEADKEACVQKTVKLSVALAESKAKVSTLESQLEEYQAIVMVQNNASTLGFGRVSATTPSKTQLPKTPSKRDLSPKTNGTVPPPVSFLPISDIQLNDSDHFLRTNSSTDDQHVDISLEDDDNNDQQQDQQQQQTNAPTVLDSECFSLESESLGWSNRPLSYLSERSSSGGNSQRGTSTSDRGTSDTATGEGGGNRLTNGLRGFRNMISQRNVNKEG